MDYYIDKKEILTIVVRETLNDELLVGYRLDTSYTNFLIVSKTDLTVNKNSANGSNTRNIFDYIKNNDNQPLFVQELLKIKMCDIDVNVDGLCYNCYPYIESGELTGKYNYKI